MSDNDRIERELERIARRMAEIIQDALDEYAPLERKRRLRKFLSKRSKSLRPQKAKP